MFDLLAEAVDLLRVAAGSLVADLGSVLVATVNGTSKICKVLP